MDRARAWAAGRIRGRPTTAFYSKHNGLRPNLSSGASLGELRFLCDIYVTKAVPLTRLIRRGWLDRSQEAQG
jgi:hypothetical protein